MGKRFTVSQVRSARREYKYKISDDATRVRCINITIVRCWLGLSQSEFTSALNEKGLQISAAALGAYERGAYASDDTVFKIAELTERIYGIPRGRVTNGRQHQNLLHYLSNHYPQEKSVNVLIYSVNLASVIAVGAIQDYTSGIETGPVIDVDTDVKEQENCPSEPEEYIPMRIRSNPKIISPYVPPPIANELCNEVAAEFSIPNNKKLIAVQALIEDMAEDKLDSVIRHILSLG